MYSQMYFSASLIRVGPLVKAFDFLEYRRNYRWPRWLYPVILRHLPGASRDYSMRLRGEPRVTFFPSLLITRLTRAVRRIVDRCIEDSRVHTECHSQEQCPNGRLPNFVATIERCLDMLGSDHKALHHRAICSCSRHRGVEFCHPRTMSPSLRLVLLTGPPFI